MEGMEKRTFELFLGLGLYAPSGALLDSYGLASNGFIKDHAGNELRFIILLLSSCAGQNTASSAKELAWEPFSPSSVFIAPKSFSVSFCEELSGSILNFGKFSIFSCP